MTTLTISSTCPDAELSAAVAEHCAGCKFTNMRGWTQGENPIASFSPPPFATSVDACLPLIKSGIFHLFRDDEPPSPVFHISIFIATDLVYDEFESSSPTAARAFCLALLKSKGFTITP